jgi:hypothetical protein
VARRGKFGAIQSRSNAAGDVINSILRMQGLTTETIDEAITEKGKGKSKTNKKNNSNKKKY